MNERIYPTVVLERVMPKQANALQLSADSIPLLKVSESVERSNREGVVVASPISVGKDWGFTAKLKARIVLGLKVRECPSLIVQV